MELTNSIPVKTTRPDMRLRNKLSNWTKNLLMHGLVILTSLSLITKSRVFKRKLINVSKLFATILAFQLQSHSTKSFCSKLLAILKSTCQNRLKWNTFRLKRYSFLLKENWQRISWERLVKMILLLIVMKWDHIKQVNVLRKEDKFQPENTLNSLSNLNVQIKRISRKFVNALSMNSNTSLSRHLWTLMDNPLFWGSSHQIHMNNFRSQHSWKSLEKSPTTATT